MEPFTVAATQVETRHLDVDHNLELHVRLIEETAAAGCHLVVFPEGSVTGSNGSEEVVRHAEPSDGRIYRTLQAEAARHRIVVSYGFCELYRGTHYNTSALVGPDGLLGLQRKVHASYDEFFRFRQAYEWDVADAGFCRVGTAICHDSDFFESWRILALMGAEVILLPHANRTMPAGGAEMVVLEHDAVVEGEAMVGPAAHTHGVLLQDAQPRRGLARVADDRPAARDGVDPRVGGRGDSREVSDNVQQRPLHKEQRPRRSRDLDDLVARREERAVVAIDVGLGRRIDGGEHGEGDRHAREHAWPPRDDDGDCIDVCTDGRL